MCDYLQRITIQYSEAEDRIKLAGELSHGGTAAIWLTHRLLQRLLPVLSNWIEQHGEGKDQLEVFQEFAQHAARAGLDRQAPVQVAADSDSWLVYAIDIAKRPQLLALTLRGEHGQQVGIALEVTQLRQWLNILHDTYLKAGWPLDEMPMWVRVGEQLTVNGTEVLH